MAGGAATSIVAQLGILDGLLPFGDDDSSDDSTNGNSDNEDAWWNHGEEVDTPSDAHHSRPEPGGFIDEANGVWSVKGGAFLQTGLSYESVTIGFGDIREPDADRPVMVQATVSVVSEGTAAEIRGRVDGTDVAKWIVDASAGALTSPPNISTTTTETFIVPAGSQYEFVNVSDDQGGNTIEDVKEVAL